MAGVGDYNKKKNLEVSSVSGTPTVSKAQPIYLSGGDDSAMGTGPVVLDWSGISGPSDIAAYDESGNLLDYEIEELDTTNETGVLWAYNDWVRDGTVQAQVAYGNGPGDRSMDGTGSNPWGNNQGSRLVQHLNESPISAVDSSPQANDGSVTGAQSVDGQYNGAASFDGTDDYVAIQDLTKQTDTFTIVAFAKTTVDQYQNIVGGDDNVASGTRTFQFRATDQGNLQLEADLGGGSFVTSSGVISDGNWHQVATTFNSSGDGILYIDSSEDGRNSQSTLNSGTGVAIGRQGYNQSGSYWSGEIDAVRYYDDVKSADWIKSDYDASAKAGQTFFAQQSSSTNQTASEAVKHIRANGGRRAEAKLEDFYQNGSYSSINDVTQSGSDSIFIYTIHYIP